ncbi:SDR family oxidoreductase [Novosphingobium resinovorum]|uniref:SDR family oxidoreductase n=1 Tax=Novosphingobium resinovorum TaxID=158500 RepID=UPI002ED4ACEC|nr:SDR family oxidoreductase [Novosphingobium resinovorum]
MDFTGQTVVVTGAGGGFGEGIAERFARFGASVVAVDMRAEAVEAVSQRIAAAGGKAIGVTADVTSDADMGKVAQAALDAFGGVDVVVNNAGITHKNRPMLEIDEAMYDRVFAVNVKSIYLSARHFVPLMRKAGGGCFVNICSTAGVRPRPGLTWYNGSKGAAIITSRSMAAELAPEGIRVNIVNPVMGETGMLADLLPGEDSAEVRARIVSTIPLGRMSQPRDIANAVTFLASDESDLITGACLEVDGGRCV